MTISLEGNGSILIVLDLPEMLRLAGDAALTTSLEGDGSVPIVLDLREILL